MNALTQAAFDLLLARLDADRQQAGLKYELLRRKLVKFFEWRGAAFCEDLADDTINRVARNLEAGEEIRDLPAYCAGTARLVFLESLRSRRNEAAVEELPDPTTVLNSEMGARMDCLERCLQKLPPEEADLIMQYYQSEKPNRIAARGELATRLGIPLNALRIRTHRIRARLEDCVEQCMKKVSGE
jgi:DNA-directed RNA polymerase specialized sigma24 family protein